MTAPAPEVRTTAPFTDTGASTADLARVGAVDGPYPIDSTEAAIDSETLSDISGKSTAEGA